jgi:uncharacterized OB-fold protein
VAEPVVHLRDFFERARAGRLTAIRCGRCAELAMPPREFCASCHERAWQPVDLSGDGTIASYTVIRVAPARHAADAPYAVAVVALKEGVSVMGRMLDVPLDRLSIGLPVRFRPIVRNGETSIGFVAV